MLAAEAEPVLPSPTDTEAPRAASSGPLPPLINAPSPDAPTLRCAVTHCHTRTTLPPLLDDATAWTTALAPKQARAHVSSPFAPVPEPPCTRRARGTSRGRHLTLVRQHQPPLALTHAA